MRSKLTVGAAIVIACVALGALAYFGPGSAPASRHSASGPPYYLALGDSLAVGDQPNAQGIPTATNQGYVNLLYATERKKIKGLKLEQLGCPGETTTTMLNGGLCPYPGGNQMAAALAFIAQHKIALLTLNIGGNDIAKCVSYTVTINSQCIAGSWTTIDTNVPKIAKRLRAAVGSKVKLAAMTYENPYLGAYLDGPTGRRNAAASVPLAKKLNELLSTNLRADGFRVANVADAFDIYTPFTTKVKVPGRGRLPLAVAKACELTWTCAAQPRGPNPHPNAAGYRTIARAFAAILR